MAKLNWGMIGGGEGSQIGPAHRLGALADGHFSLAAGALDHRPDVGRNYARRLGVAPDRAYGDWREMLAGERDRPDRCDLVTVATPNATHFEISKAFLEAGFHVLCEKPMTVTVEEGEELVRIAEKTGRICAVNYCYSAYPMVRQAREMVKSGELGEIRLVQMEYPQDWLAEPIEQTGQKQAAWRTDPKQSGAGGSTGDIGTHAYNLGCFVSGLELEELAADVHTFVKGRQLDDNAHVMMRFAGGAKGLLWCSQVATGHENGLKVRVYGTKGGLEWVQADPNYLWFTPLGKPRQLITRSGAGAGPAASRVTRIPSGHPEGYLEGFATIYTEAAKAMIAKRNGTKLDPDVIYPTVEDGVKGVAFVEACIASSKRNGAWVKV